MQKKAKNILFFIQSGMVGLHRHCGEPLRPGPGHRRPDPFVPLLYGGRGGAAHRAGRRDRGPGAVHLCHELGARRVRDPRGGEHGGGPGRVPHRAAVLVGFLGRRPQLPGHHLFYAPDPVKHRRPRREKVTAGAVFVWIYSA